MKRSEDLAQTTIARLAGSDMLAVILYKKVVRLGSLSERLIWTSHSRGVEEEAVDRVQVKAALLVLNGLQGDRSLHHSSDPLCVPYSCYAARAHRCRRGPKHWWSLGGMGEQ